MIRIFRMYRRQYLNAEIKHYSNAIDPTTSPLMQCSVSIGLGWFHCTLAHARRKPTDVRVFFHNISGEIEFLNDTNTTLVQCLPNWTACRWPRLSPFVPAVDPEWIMALHLCGIGPLITDGDCSDIEVGVWRTTSRWRSRWCLTTTRWSEYSTSW